MSIAVTHATGDAIFRSLFLARSLRDDQRQRAVHRQNKTRSQGTLQTCSSCINGGAPRARLGRLIGRDAGLLPRIGRPRLFGRRSVVIVAGWEEVPAQVAGRFLSLSESQGARERRSLRLSELQHLRHWHVPVGVIGIALKSHRPRDSKAAAEVKL